MLKRGVDLGAGLVTLEYVVAELGARQTRITGRTKGAKYFIRCRVAQRVAEDKARRILATLPDRQRRPQMRRINLGLAIEQRIDQRQPDALRLGPPDHSAEQTRKTLAQRRV